MPKLSTERIRLNGAVENEIDFKFDISVSKEGVFSTMIPKDVVELFTNANVDLNKNRLYNKGYVTGATPKEVCDNVKSICQEYLSRELISESIVLKYGIETRAAYCLGTDGEIYPNGCFKEAIKKDDGYSNGGYANWKNGTVDINATHKNNFGVLVYVTPLNKLVYKYRSGKTKEEYVSIHEHENEVINWLANLTCIAPNGLKIKEIEFTYNIGMVFINMIKSLCRLNEQIKDFLEPDGIRLIANSEMKKLL